MSDDLDKRVVTALTNAVEQNHVKIKVFPKIWNIVPNVWEIFPKNLKLHVSRKIFQVFRFPVKYVDSRKKKFFSPKAALLRVGTPRRLICKGPILLLDQWSFLGNCLPTPPQT